MGNIVIAGGGAGIVPHPHPASDATLRHPGYGLWRKILCVGDPVGDAEPFLSAAKGSEATRLDAADGTSPLWVKHTNDGANSDWKNLALVV